MTQSTDDNDAMDVMEQIKDDEDIDVVSRSSVGLQDNHCAESVELPGDRLSNPAAVAGRHDDITDEDAEGRRRVDAAEAELTSSNVSEVVVKFRWYRSLQTAADKVFLNSPFMKESLELTRLGDADSYESRDVTVPCGIHVGNRLDVDSIEYQLEPFDVKHYTFEIHLDIDEDDQPDVTGIDDVTLKSRILKLTQKSSAAAPDFVEPPGLDIDDERPSGASGRPPAATGSLGPPAESMDDVIVEDDEPGSRRAVSRVSVSASVPTSRSSSLRSRSGGGAGSGRRLSQLENLLRQQIAGSGDAAATTTRVVETSRQNGHRTADDDLRASSGARRQHRRSGERRTTAAGGRESGQQQCWQPVDDVIDCSSSHCGRSSTPVDVQAPGAQWESASLPRSRSVDSMTSQRRGRDAEVTSNGAAATSGSFARDDVGRGGGVSAVMRSPLVTSRVTHLVTGGGGSRSGPVVAGLAESTANRDLRNSSPQRELEEMVITLRRKLQERDRQLEELQQNNNNLQLFLTQLQTSTADLKERRIWELMRGKENLNTDHWTSKQQHAHVDIRSLEQPDDADRCYSLDMYSSDGTAVMNRKMGELESHLVNVQEANEATTAKLTEAEMTNTTLRQQNESLRKQRQLLEIETKTLREQLQKLQNSVELDGTRSLFHEIQQLRKEMRSLCDDNRQLKQENRVLAQTLNCETKHSDNSSSGTLTKRTTSISSLQNSDVNIRNNMDSCTRKEHPEYSCVHRSPSPKRHLLSPDPRNESFQSDRSDSTVVSQTADRHHVDEWKVDHTQQVSDTRGMHSDISWRNTKPAMNRVAAESEKYWKPNTSSHHTTPESPTTSAYRKADELTSHGPTSNLHNSQFGRQSSDVNSRSGSLQRGQSSRPVLMDFPDCETLSDISIVTNRTLSGQGSSPLDQKPSMKVRGRKDNATEDLGLSEAPTTARRLSVSSTSTETILMEADSMLDAVHRSHASHSVTQRSEDGDFLNNSDDLLSSSASVIGSLRERCSVETKSDKPFSTTQRDNVFSPCPKRPFAPRSPNDLSVGDAVKFSRLGGKISKGQVKYIGHLPGKNDLYIGVELDHELGKHDGVYDGHRLFQCQPNRGVFVAFSKIIMAWCD